MGELRRSRILATHAVVLLVLIAMLGSCTDYRGEPDSRQTTSAVSACPTAPNTGVATSRVLLSNSIAPTVSVHVGDTVLLANPKTSEGGQPVQFTSPTAEDAGVLCELEASETETRFVAVKAGRVVVNSHSVACAGCAVIGVSATVEVTA